MKKTKQKILATALELYNAKGVGNVSIRQLAKEIGISHSNLIYHYPSLEDVILGLHELLLQKAMELNKEISKEESPLVSLFRTTQK
ncbi:MAG: TetR/AcrR family transcriptional regulator, partial [Bacteroidota bacterium]